MRKRFLLAGVAWLALGASPPLEWTVRGDGVVQGSVGGAPARIRIDPAAPAAPLVITEVARRAGLRSGPFDFDYSIGNARITGKTAVTRIDFGLGPTKRRVGWTDAPYSPGVEGAIGPGLLPPSRIVFQLRSRRAGERSMALPMVGQGGLEGRWGERFALIQVGGQPMRVQFDPQRPRTLATATAGARIAGAGGGVLSGATEPVEIAFGIKRPARTLKLRTPLIVGPLSVPVMAVRTNASGAVGGITDEVASPDPDEIVVVGRRSNPGIDQLRLGRDQLDRCSSIIFDKPAKVIRLSCL